jgi:hypothetical protein
MINTSSEKGMSNYLRIVHDLRSRNMIPADTRKARPVIGRPKKAVSKTIELVNKQTEQEAMAKKFADYQRQQLANKLKSVDRLGHIKSVGNGL